MKDKNDWDKIRYKYLRLNEKHSAETEKCKKCVWANKESSKIFCSRYKCTEGWTIVNNLDTKRRKEKRLK